MLRGCVLAACGGLALLMVSLPSASSAAATCSYGIPEDPRDRLRAEAAAADLILIGKVMSERLMTPEDRPVVLPAHIDAYESTVTTQAILVGDERQTEIRIAGLGFFAPDCSGGPRLLAGEQVMLFLYEWSYVARGGEVDAWFIGVAGGKVVLADEEARFDYGDGASETAGDAREFIESAARMVDASPEATAAALFAAGFRSESGRTPGDWLLISAGVVLLTATLAGASFGLGWRAAKRRYRG